MNRPRRGWVEWRSIALVILYSVALPVFVGTRGAAAESFDVYWISDGCGYLAEIQGGQLKLFEITPLSCLPGDTLTLQAEPPDPRGARYVSKDSDVVVSGPGTRS